MLTYLPDLGQPNILDDILVNNCCGNDQLQDRALGLCQSCLLVYILRNYGHKHVNTLYNKVLANPYS